MTSIEIRILEPAGIEDYHAHVLRLDLASRRLAFADCADDRSIDGHCLRLMNAQTIVIGAFIDGILRAGIEIIPDRTARQAEAILTIETAYRSRDLTRMLIARLFDEARRYRLAKLILRGLEDHAAIEEIESVNGIDFVKRDPPSRVLRVCIAPSLSPAGVSSAAPRLYDSAFTS